MLREEGRPWLKVYGDRIPPRVIEESLPAFLENAARSFPSHTALTMGERAISYRELLELSEGFAAALHGAGVRKGDRVGLMLPNCPEYVIGFFGIVRTGAAATQINPLYVGRELEHILSNSGTETAVVHAAMYPKVKDVQPRTPLRRVVCVGEPEGGLADGDLSFERFLDSASGPPPEVEIDPVEDLASIQYTGGTTGISKGAMLTHRNLLGGVQQTIDLLIENPEDFPENGRVVAVAPLFHIFGMTMVLLFSLRHGWNLLLVPKFQPDEMMQLIKRERPIMLAGVATLYMALHSYPEMEKYGLDEVLLYTSGGASVPVGLMRSFKQKTGRDIWEGYGLSEGAPVSFNTYLRGPVPGSVGVPIPGTDVRVVDPETGEREMPPGEPGELLVKGPQVMKGYWNMPGETEKALRDGWLYTGDIVRMDEEGYLYIVDRKKDMINVSGYKVYPREVEEVLYAHPEVVEAVVVGSPDPYRGEVVKAFVVRKEGSALTEEDLVEHCRGELAPYKVPKAVEFREELPKSAVGKLLRRVLAQEERARKQKGAE
ncbi:long-chain-fatty-acid--CoA ligase [Rubrobacter xylanophilus]|uniref:Long-chain-fatty-acid--CoA ligase n=1 Tax=Rubrobacter xylanophilus TaxID=49319 RepID=A0A510HKV2_9ACTN|nr:long-chain fatty acid--CoA ligase [Rubrobacter xylanophilus]BBL79223.1 long-chain-fatty-acid--CoA ligase [Rubrobacter xylanophilus]